MLCGLAEGYGLILIKLLINLSFWVTFGEQNTHSAMQPICS